MSGWSPVVHDGHGNRTDITRENIVRAAAQQFARRLYHKVSVDDIVAEAQVTKSARYFHFRSKDELAVAIIEARTTATTIAVKNLFAQRLSGLETLLGFCLLIAVEDTSQDLARAALNLLEVIEHPEEHRAKVLGTWIKAVAAITRRAVADGDLQPRCDPQDVAHLIVAVRVGLQQSSNLDEPETVSRGFREELGAHPGRHRAIRQMRLFPTIPAASGGAGHRRRVLRPERAAGNVAALPAGTHSPTGNRSSTS